MRKLAIIGLLLLPGFIFGVQKFDSCTLLSNCSEVLSNSIVGSPQYSVPYYSSSGIGSTLTGLVPGTFGQVLTSSGTAGAPFWGPNVSSLIAGSGISISCTNGVCTITNTGGGGGTTYVLMEDSSLVLAEDGSKVLTE